MNYMTYMEEKPKFFISNENCIDITLIFDKYPVLVKKLGIKSEFDNIVGVFNDLGFDIKFDKDENIVDISFIGDGNIDNQRDFLFAISCLIKEGSYIKFIKEDGTRYCWNFYNSVLKETKSFVWEK